MRRLAPLVPLLLLLLACRSDTPDLSPEHGHPEAAAPAAEGHPEAAAPAAEGPAAEGAPEHVHPEAARAAAEGAFEADLAALQTVASRVLVTLPSDATWTERLPTVFWFHGYGWHPGFAEEARVQQWADEHGWAFVGVSATNLRVAGRFEWTENNEQDIAWVTTVRDALFEHGPFDPDRVIAMGFSQGGALSVKLLAAQPERWRGAIALSPGAVTGQAPVATNDLTGRRAVITAGAGERVSIVTLSHQLDEQLRGMGAAVDLRIVEGMSEHTFPPDFATLFPVWVAAILAEPSAP